VFPEEWSDEEDDEPEIGQLELSFE